MSPGRTSGPDLGKLEARVGFEPLSSIDPMQLTDSTTRQKRQNGQIARIEVRGGYTRPFAPMVLAPRRPERHGGLGIDCRVGHPATTRAARAPEAEN